MVWSLLLWLTMAPLSRATFPVCENTTTSAGSVANATEVPVEVNVQGQSGKFTLVPKGSSGNSVGIRVTMDALREVDSAGTSVGKTGRARLLHKISQWGLRSKCLLVL